MKLLIFWCLLLCQSLVGKASVITTKTYSNTHGLRLEFSVEGTYTDNAPVAVSITLVNERGDTIYYPAIDGITELGLVVTDSNGISIPVTAARQMMIDSGIYRSTVSPLNPQASKIWNLTDLRKLFSLQPGTFIASVHITVFSLNGGKAVTLAALVIKSPPFKIK